MYAFVAQVFDNLSSTFSELLFCKLDLTDGDYVPLVWMNISGVFFKNILVKGQRLRLPYAKTGCIYVE